MNRPLVSILIPVTGNSTYLELALTSVLLQTYTNIEIIIRDSTPTDQIQVLLEKDYLPYYDKMIYIKDLRYMPKLEILQELLRVANGTYVNFMMEKDLFYPTKIEKMMDYFLKDVSNPIKLVTSNIESIDMHGNVINNFNKIHDIDMQWNHTGSIDFILRNNKHIGGLSAPLFSKRDLVETFGTFAGHQFVQEIELASWLNLVSQGALVFLAEELTFERISHAYQSNKITIDLITDWMNLIKLLKINGYIINSSTEKYVIIKILEWIEFLLLNKQHTLTIAERETIYEYKEHLHVLQFIK
ncbi:glycosyltransferase [Bacillus tropicus]|uniref:glycosyltransferase n=2 Tax=Bacillus tropicus TaxID=2026188 RepID=UPI000B454D6A|nr:glycosyltransferase [Bacillus tropicus]MBG9934821.1 hypothetical protein [Bacillus tropicus]MED2996885.1 glycosyltransferase [Bacillus tropicus]OTY62975.1 hypothetical protein BK748_00585 [Bacillus thuringiensis serovar graciosensis]